MLQFNLIIKSLLIKVILLVCSFFLILSVLEIAFSIINKPMGRQRWRISGVFRLDKELIYSLKPNEERLIKTNRFKEHAIINSHGLRDNEIKERSLFEKRIIIIGDSMTFGHGVSNTQTFPNQLERIYIQKNRQIDVINAGIKGYGTDQAYKLFVTRLCSLAPDLLIFALYTNDITDNIILPLYTLEKGRLFPLDPKKNWLYVLGTIERYFPTFFRQRRLYHFIWSRLAGKDLFLVLPRLNREELLKWSQNKIRLQIEQLQKLGKTDGFNLMILCVPCKNCQSGSYNWLNKDGLFLLDSSQNVFWTLNKSTLFFKNDYHLNVKGNRMLAMKIYEYIKNNMIL
jgi:lysophospholipase L1-like esterase